MADQRRQRQDDDDSPKPYELGWHGGAHETPQHVAWLQTGCNDSLVRALIYMCSNGIPYYKSRRCVKCGVDAETQVLRPFETLHRMGHYDDFHKYTTPDDAIINTLPTAMMQVLRSSPDCAQFGCASDCFLSTR